jgi:hypothetical protein
LSLALRRGRGAGAREASCTLATQIGQRSAGVPWRQNFDTVAQFIGALGWLVVVPQKPPIVGARRGPIEHTAVRAKEATDEHRSSDRGRWSREHRAARPSRLRGATYAA